MQQKLVISLLEVGTAYFNAALKGVQALQRLLGCS